MKQVLFLSLMLACLSPSAALAGADEANSCAATLPDTAKKIYQAVLPQIKPGVDASSIMTTTLKAMVSSGEVGKFSARSNAKVASLCLKKLNS